MATGETGTGARLGADDDRSRTVASRDNRFITEIFDGADEALAALEVVESGLLSTGFQTRDWLTVLYEELAATRRALPRLVVVSDRERDKAVLALPLVIAKEGLLRVANFADLGVTDYGGPMLGREPLSDRQLIRGIWRSVRAAMWDVDLIRLNRMPAEIGGRPNPLLNLFGSAPSSVSSRQLVLPGSFASYLQSLEKKHRKDVERCYRLWEAEGNPRFYRATTDDEIAHVFATLEEQQAVWHAAHGTEDALAEPPIRAFYERLAFDGADAGLTALFALEAGGRIAAIVFGLLHDGTFTLLRISTGGEQWSHLSPGRLVVLETVKHLVGQGVHRFDMGVHSDPLKQAFGTEGVALYDLVTAQDVTALPKALVHEIAVHFRAGRSLRSALKKAMQPLAG